MPIKKSQLRIIAGKFRSRKIFFYPDNAELRPTLNRVRETLFNWLSVDVVGSICLDLFAGSGIFAFEALSRGASYCLSVEQNYNSYKTIIENKIHLNIKDEEFKIINQDALLTLEQPNIMLNNLSDNYNKKFNIVFLDPPYNQHKTILLEIVHSLINNNLLQPNSKIYFECNTNDHIFKEPNFPKDLQIIKSSKAGKVYFYLVEYLCSTNI
jgi:16S rRNA (guanine966-N2)-methyltransferase